MSPLVRFPGLRVGQIRAVDGLAEGDVPPACRPGVISVVIPCYNEEKALGRTLDRLLPHCVERDLEVVISDDGSTDRTRVIARRASRCVASTDGIPRSPARTRNRGANAALGEIFVFIDADILVHDPAFFFEEIRRRFRNGDLVAATADCAVYPESAGIGDRAYHVLYNRFTWLCNMLGLGTSGGWCQVVRRDAFFAVGGYDARFPSGQDVDLFLRLSRLGKTRLIRSLLVLESPRRYRAQGLLRTAVGWFLNGVWVYLFRRPYLKRYRTVR